ncbi:MAG: acyl-CoA dehydrogenase family protein [Gammaproteobacteria bacterium]|nr:acyl-CoA dehydrogenase family protein [Gammaproteobacteria bacterium]
MEDFLLLDNLLHEEEKLIRDSVGRFVNSLPSNLFIDANDSGYFPKELIPEIAKLGILGMTLPEEYGGSQTNYVSYGLACQELERADSALRSFVSVQSSLCMYPIFRYGTTEQKQRFLARMAKGELIGCFGLTEPDSGSDPGSMQSVAQKVSGGWKLNGTKMWITNAPFADIAIVWAKTDQGIRGFIVERDFPGFKTEEIKKKFSLRASSTGEIILEDCFIPDENFLEGTDKGLGAALSCLNQARFGIAWGAMGAAMSCFDTALHYTLMRKQFKKPLASFQLIQEDLADMFTEIVKAQCMNLQIGRLKDQNKASPAMISLAKMNSCREALKIARKARNLLGASGISLEYPVIRHMVNLESVFTYEGTDNVHHLILGKHLTGIDAFSG